MPDSTLPFRIVHIDHDRPHLDLHRHAGSGVAHWRPISRPIAGSVRSFVIVDLLVCRGVIGDHEIGIAPGFRESFARHVFINRLDDLPVHVGVFRGRALRPGVGAVAGKVCALVIVDGNIGGAGAQQSETQ